MRLILFPNQLFELGLLPKEVQHVYLIEHPNFFAHPNPEIRYHKQKLILHRASMQTYKDMLQKHGLQVDYIDFSLNSSTLADTLTKQGIKECLVFDPVDELIGTEITNANNSGCQINILPNPGFLLTQADMELFCHTHKNAGLQKFYLWQRKRLNLLVTPEGKPFGGKWTFDQQNRKRLPESVEVPKLPTLKYGHYIETATEYIQKLFPNNPGDIQDFIYPTNHHQAKEWLQVFITQRLANFGMYQDAITVGGNFLFHSVLGPVLNIGLITPKQVIKEVMDYYASHPETPIASVEGFVRQIIGWREFCRLEYTFRGNQIRQGNYWHNFQALPQAVWHRNTQLPPLDYALNRVHLHAYTHHIERLMVIGNWMLLCEVHPQDVYNWFMSMFIDAYDWAMVPNVFGMSQYSDGGSMATKPYVSGSNYILKMSNYKKGEWVEIWDALFWRFIYKHKEKIDKNPRLGIVIKQLGKMPKPTIQKKLETAQRYLHELHKRPANTGAQTKLQLNQP